MAGQHGEKEDAEKSWKYKISVCCNIHLLFRHGKGFVDFW